MHTFKFQAFNNHTFSKVYSNTPKPVKIQRCLSHVPTGYEHVPPALFNKTDYY